MLEYGVAAIVTPIRKCHYSLTKSIADSKHEWQSTSRSKDDSQDELENSNRDCEIIEMEKKIPRIDVHWEEKFKIMEQNITSIKKELEIMKAKNNTTRGVALNCLYVTNNSAAEKSMT